MIACAGIAIDYLRGVRTAADLQQVADGAALAAASAQNLTGSITEKSNQRVNIATNYITETLKNVSDVEIVGSPQIVAGPSTVDITVNAKVKGSLANVLTALPDDVQIDNGADGSSDESMDIDLSVHSKVGFASDTYVCLLEMNPTLAEAVYFQGNSEFMAACSVHANSNATVALKTWGSAEAYATSFCARGGWAGSGFDPMPKGGCGFKDDPYGSLTLPTAGSCMTTAGITVTDSPGGSSVTANSTNGVKVKKATATLTPGTFCGGLHVSTAGTVNLQKGLYIIKDGTFDVDSQSTVNAETGVVFYLTGAGAYIDIMSGAVVKIKGPNKAVAATATSPAVAATTTAATEAYAGFAIMQDRETNVGGTNTIYSKGGVDIQGAFYTPKQKLVIWANDTMNGNSKYFPMIVDSLNMNGTATLYVNLDYKGANFEDPIALKQSGYVRVSE